MLTYNWSSIIKVTKYELKSLVLYNDFLHTSISPPYGVDNNQYAYPLLSPRRVKTKCDMIDLYGFVFAWSNNSL